MIVMPQVIIPLFINNKKIFMDGERIPDLLAAGRKTTDNQITLKPVSYSFIVFEK